MQRNLIGKSEGLLFTARVAGTGQEIKTFSAHFETFYADTYFVIAPEHPLLPELLAGRQNKEEVLAFCQHTITKRMQTREEDVKDSEGIFTGIMIDDPVSGTQLPLWVASFAIADYGTGIVKCSAHDERDFNFAKKYNISLKVALVPAHDENLKARVMRQEVCFTDMVNGILIESDIFSGKR